MSDIQEKILELMDLFDEDEVTTADKINRPEPKQSVKEIELFNEFNIRNPKAGGGMLAQPSADGSRQEYATSTVKTKKFKYPITNQFGTFYSDKKPKSSAREIGSGKFSMAERNRVTRIKYPEYNSYSELLKKEPKKARVVMSTLQYASVAGTKIKKKTRFTPLTIIQQNKILAEFPSANFDEGKLGFNSETDKTKYQQVKKFIERGYKPRFKKIPEKLQEDIKQKFSYFKDWDFNKYKYGVPGSGGGGKGNIRNRENNVLAQRVKRYISEPKPFKLAFSMDRPGSWMLQQMYRAWEHGNTDYEPIYNKNDKVIGMKENGKTYYANKNVAPSNKVKLINSHPEFNKVQKFVDVANEAKLPLKDLSGYKNTKSLLALFPEGYESIKFNDLVSYLYKEQGVDATRNAIEKHHLKSLSDMGAPVDSKNLQLLRKDLNTLGNTITQQIKKGDLSRVADLEKAGVKITVDGKTYGKGFQDPRRQFNRIIGDITQKVSGLNKTQYANLLNAFCKPGRSKLSNGTNPDGLTCSMEEIQRGIQRETDKARKVSIDGRIPKKFGKLRTLGATLFGVADPAIEFMFAAPYLVAGDIDGAKQATTAGLFGYGKKDISKMSNKEAQRYMKHLNATGDWMKNYFIAEEKKQELKNLKPNTGAFDLATKQLNIANQKLEQIGDDYGTFGYSYKGYDTPLVGKVAMQDQIRSEVARDFNRKIDKAMSTEFFKDSDPITLEENLKSLGGDPKKVTPITNLESYMANKGEPMAGNTNLFFDVKPYVLNRAMQYGVEDIFDDYALGAGVEAPGRKSLQDAYSEIPLEYANQLAALEKKQLEEGLLERQLDLGTGFAGGGIAKLAGVDQGPPPESGPNSQGLSGLFKRVKNI